ncbi:MAG: Outer rane lipoprotein, partial [Candidatus Krumholzibacteriota bacterium]|nr:Outer rane lipoprotein [Candidatus Krumholzibacteriota bacterium]
FGARYRQLALDYAYRDGDLGDNHRISFAVRFGASTPQRQAQARAKLEAEVNSMLTARVVEMERSHVDNSMAEADSLFEAGDLERAAGLYERVLLWDPENAAAENRLVEYSAASSLSAVCDGKIKAAQNDQVLLADILKSSIDLYANRRFAEALSGFDEALRVAPNTKLALEYAGKCRAAIGDIVRRARSDAAARAKRGDFDGAILALESVREYGSFDPSIAKELEEYKSGRREAGRAEAETASAEARAGAATAGNADDRTLDEKYRSGIAEFNAGRFDRATELFLKVWTARPDYYNVTELLTKAYLFVGMGYYSDNKYPEAIDAWQRALTVDPDNSKAKRYLSKTREEMQKLEGAHNGR